nr:MULTISPECIES: TIGR02391 family protein [Streptomyces]
MDRKWMRARLEGFEETAAQYWSVRGVNGDTTQEQRCLFEAEPTINRILRHLSPDKPDLEVLGENDWGGLTIDLSQVSRGIGILADMDEWATRLAPESPSLPADRFHAWVWGAAQTFWESAHYRASVHAAATSINAHLQNKLGRRDLSDTKLIQEAFSDKAPESGKPRLRLPGDPGDPGVQTRQRAVPFSSAKGHTPRFGTRRPTRLVN